MTVAIAQNADYYNGQIVSKFMVNQISDSNALIMNFDGTVIAVNMNGNEINLNT